MTTISLFRPPDRLRQVYRFAIASLIVSASVFIAPHVAQATDITDKAFETTPVQTVTAITPDAQLQNALIAITPQQISPADAVTATSNHSVRERFQYLTDRASELAVQAMTAIGIHYKYGGTNPERGLDCSGLVKYVFKEAWGLVLPRTAAEMSKQGVQVSKQDLQPGDLIFFNTLRRSFSHVGIYLGDNKFIHAPSTGGKVRIENMDQSYWEKRFNGARRISAPELSADTGTLPQIH